MENKEYYEYCIYTIKHSQDLERSLLTTGEGTFIEKNKWIEAQKMLIAANSLKQNLVVVFAPAEMTLSLHSWAILTDVDIDNEKSLTKYSFKNLTKIIEYEYGVYKSELVLKSTGKNLSEKFIRPYSICKTPYEIIENFSMDIDEFVKNYFEIKPTVKEKVNELKSVLMEIDRNMDDIEAERKEIEINRIFRNDAPIVKLLKRYYNNHCQFPDCNAKIETKSGIDYVEVAHITPVREGGKSKLNNLLVLCPNHHKEFDLGVREIIKWDETHIEGRLNGCYFDIKFLDKI